MADILSPSQLLRVLLVEDSKGDALLIEKTLAKAAPGVHHVQHVATLASALKTLTENEFDVVLLDRSLPDTTGFNGLLNIQEKAPNLPIIFLTAFKDETVALNAIEHGAQDYLLKDQIDGNTIKRAIQYAIQRKKSERALEETNQLNTAILSSTAYLVIAMDKNGGIITFNKAAEDALGYKAEEVVGKETPILWHDPQEVALRAHELSAELGETIKPEFDVFIRKPLLSGIESREWTFIRKDRSRFLVNLTTTTLRDKNNAVTGYLGVIEDITERRKMERMKSEFISIVSHELRTPLTSIRGALAPLAQGAAGTLPEKAARLATIAHKNSERLVRIVNDILDIEKIDSGKLQMCAEPVDVTSILQQAIEANQSYGEKYQVRFVLESVPENVSVMADPERFMQIMANLLSNAAKFSSHGAEVRVRAESKQTYMRFFVQDGGIGIPEEFRSRIFEKFVQADNSAARRYEGTGLGLNITQKLVEAMKGKIGFESETGKGTTFYFDLPMTEKISAFIHTDHFQGKQKL